MSSSTSSISSVGREKGNEDAKRTILKPFSCDRCERRFNSKYNVVRHVKQYHADRRMFKCCVCGREYKWVDSLHKHMKMHNNIRQLEGTKSRNL